MPKKLQLYGGSAVGDYTSIQDPFRELRPHDFQWSLEFLAVYPGRSLKYSSRLRRYLAAHEPKTRLVYKKKIRRMKKGGIWKAGLSAPRQYSKAVGFLTTFRPMYSFWVMDRVASITPTKPPTTVGLVRGGAAHPTGVFLQPFAMNRKFAWGWQKRRNHTGCDPVYWRISQHLQRRGAFIRPSRPHRAAPAKVYRHDSPCGALDAKERCRRFDE